MWHVYKRLNGKVKLQTKSTIQGVQPPEMVLELFWMEPYRNMLQKLSDGQTN